MSELNDKMVKNVAPVAKREADVFLSKINARISEVAAKVASEVGLETESVLEFKEGMMTIEDYVRLKMSEGLKPE